MKIRTFFASALLICAQLISAQFLFVSVEAHASSDREAVAACLSNWGKHPFGKDLAEVKFRTISPGVKILGIGGSNLNVFEKKENPHSNKKQTKQNIF